MNTVYLSIIFIGFGIGVVGYIKYYLNKKEANLKPPSFFLIMVFLGAVGLFSVVAISGLNIPFFSSSIFTSVIAGTEESFGLFGTEDPTATTYYIDYNSGDDSNDGISTATPWKHAPGDSNATGKAASTTLKPGDSVIFKGGVVYTGPEGGTLITIGQSGTDGDFITYRGNTKEGDWGTGKAVIDMQYQYYHAFSAVSKNYIKISNFEIKNAKNIFSSSNLTGSCPEGQAKITRDGVDQCIEFSGSGSVGDLGVILNSGGGSHWVINDSIFHDVEHYSDLCVENSQHDGDSSSPYAVIGSQNWIRLRGPGVTDVEIINNEFYAAGGTIIGLYGTDRVTIKNNNFGGINRGAKTGWFNVAVRVEASAGTLDSYNKNLYIQDNIFHDGWQYGGDDPNQRCHAGNWIHIYGYETVMHDNIHFERNLWYNNRDFSYHHASAMSQADSVSNFYVRNNVFINPQAGNGTMNFYSRNINAWFENDTVVAYGTNGVAVNGMDTGKIRNNICINLSSNSSNVCYYSSTATMPSESDNNIYYLPNGANAWRYGAKNYSLSEWKTFSGKDTSSDSGNPQLNNVPATGETTSMGNYSLTSASINAIDQAVTIADFSDDYNGSTRPQGPAWDIGAYEYVTPASAGKAITVFDLNELIPIVTGTINEGAKTISLTVPFGTNITALTPTIVHTGSSISPNTGIAQDFTSPIIYTVTAGDASTQDYLVTVTVLPSSDTTAPIRSAASPSGRQSAGTTQVTLSLATDKNATCKYSTIAGTAYISMTGKFTSTGTQLHTTNISGLSNGNSYKYYIRCSDGDNTNTDDYIISFSIASATSLISSGGGGGSQTTWALPSVPLGGFKVNINGGAATTSSKNVILQFNAGADIKKMAISMTGDFTDASQEDYTVFKLWNLCSNLDDLVENPICPDGKYTVYVKFYNAHNRTSDVATVSSSIVLDSNIINSPIDDITNENNQPKQSQQSFTKHLRLDMQDADIKRLQLFLNQDLDTRLDNKGAGSPGQETNYFGPKTWAAVRKFQEKYSKEVLSPWGLTQGTGYVGKTTLAKINQLISRIPSQ